MNPERHFCGYAEAGKPNARRYLYCSGYKVVAAEVLII